MYVELLKRELVGAQLAIWNGTSGLPPEQEQKIKDHWLAEATKTQTTLARRPVLTRAEVEERRKRNQERLRRAGGGCGCGKKRTNG